MSIPRAFCRYLIAILPLSVLSCTPPVAGDDGGAPEVVQLGPIRGRWILDREGKPIPSRSWSERERGLQTSGLMSRAGVLWSIGDQRGEFPGRLLRIDPKTGRLLDAPLRLELAKDFPDGRLAEVFRAIPNHDFEGIAPHPSRDDAFFAVTEDKNPWLVEIRVVATEPPRAEIPRILELELPPGYEPYRGDTNYRVEGIATSTDGKTLYLAFERLHDRLPRILTLDMPDVTAGRARPRELRVNFESLPPRGDKARAMLNINGIAVVSHAGEDLLVAVARDQERLLVIHPASGKVRRAIDLVLRSPEGEKMLWVSPEGVAVDASTRRGWIVNDPDSIRGNYRRLENDTAQGRFAELVPQLFEFSLVNVIGD